MGAEHQRQVLVSDCRYHQSPEAVSSWVYNVDTEGMRLLTNDGHDMTQLILGAGYWQVAVDPKYGDPLTQKYAINPGCYALFELAENQLALS